MTENLESMIDKLNAGVQFGESLGADFMELRYDNLNILTINNTNLDLKDVLTKQTKGVGIMAYVKGVEGSSFTPDLSQKGINEAVKKAYQMAHGIAPHSKLNLPFPRTNKNSQKIPSKAKIHPKDVEFSEKLGYLKRIYEGIQEHSDSVSSTILYGELWGDKIFVNSESNEIIWHPLVVDLAAIAISMSENGSPARSLYRKGGCEGLEIYQQEENTPEKIGEMAGKFSKEQTKAKSIKSGKYRALVGSLMGGVIAHESFGHLSEADGVVNHNSPISDKMGKQLGTSHATIIDEGLPAYSGGFYLPFDDQGTPANKTVLLEKGILKNFLHSRGTASYLNQPLSGNNRAINFMFPPIPRMTNTYFEKGDLSHEEALELLGTGIYAIDSMGGQVSDDGNFLFQCARGYYVENGEIKYNIKDSSLSGNILDFLMQIQGATNTLKLQTGYFGGCGKKGQSPLPVGMGGPELLIKEVQVGGA